MGEQGKAIPAFGYFPKKNANGEVIKDAQGQPVYELKEEPENVKNTVYGFQDKHLLLPIPLKEIEVNYNMNQNEGW
ncbi:RagB/SusD family nutrient uptake outer membrane protein [Bacteroides heparinolyticus]|uniref:RagB/SusD family nutrient uptake outer membrane protein n=1 Tax=Prevotella heparinolytica TaxID=28113 RepID=UPI0035A0B467